MYFTNGAHIGTTHLLVRLSAPYNPIFCRSILSLLITSFSPLLFRLQTCILNRKNGKHFSAFRMKKPDCLFFVFVFPVPTTLTSALFSSCNHWASVSHQLTTFSCVCVCMYGHKITRCLLVHLCWSLPWNVKELMRHLNLTFLLSFRHSSHTRSKCDSTEERIKLYVVLSEMLYSNMEKK